MNGRPVPLPVSLGAVFTRSQAREAGLGSRRLSQPDVERIAHGVYRRRAGLDADRDVHPAERWRQRQLALACDLGAHLSEGSFIAGASAAALWGLPVPAADTDVLEVGRLSGRRASRDSRILSREVQPHLVKITVLRGVPITTPAVTWAMRVPRLCDADAVAMGDAILHESRIPGTSRLRRPPLALPKEMEEAVLMGRRPDVVRLRRLLPQLSTRSASVPESHLRLRLQEWGAPDPQLDYDVYDSNGALVGCSEFAYPEFKLALEYEGGHHLRDPRQWNRDIEKYREYAQLGWEPLRVTADLLYVRRNELRFQVFEALHRRGWRP